MRISALAAVLGILCAIGSIVLLVALPGPGVDRGSVDAQTGAVPSTAADLLDRAVATGDAVAALELLTAGADATALDAEQREVMLLLRSELAAPTAGSVSPELAPVETLFARTPTPTTTAPGLDREAAQLAGDATWLASATAARSMRMLAQRFAATGRARARDRWLARAIAAAPTDVVIRLQAATAWIADRRLAEAATVLRDVTPADRDAAAFWGMRADLARWLGDVAGEAEALAHQTEHSNDPRHTARLLDVQLALQDRTGAARTALRLADLTGLPEHRRQAADLLLVAGLTNEGLALLRRQIADDDDPQAARRRLAAVLLQDLRFDEAQVVLEDLVAHGGPAPEADDLAALEGLYRRLDRRGPLIDFLQRHVLEHTETAFELLHLLAAQDRGDEAIALLARLLTAIDDPVQFYRLVPWFADAALPDLPERAAAIAEALTPDEVTWALDATAVPGLDRRPMLRALAARFPDDPQVWRSRLDVVWALGDDHPRQALPAARDLATERPTDAPAAAMWVTFAERYGDPAELLAARTHLAAAAPGDHANRRLLAELLTRLERHDEAIAALRALVADGDVSARAMLMHGLLRAGRTDEMRALLDACAAEGPAALLAAADLLFDADVHTTALEIYLRVLELDPDQARAQLRAGVLLGWVNRPAEALPLLLRAAESPAVGRLAVAFHLAEVQWALGQKDAARESYAIAFEHRDDQPAGKLTGEMVARCLHRLGRYDDALAVYRGLLSGPNLPTATLLDLAELYVDLGDDEGLLATLGDVQRRDPHDRRLLRMRAQRCLRNGDRTGAEQFLLQIAARHELDGGELSDLGTVQEWAGEYGAALATYQRWVAMQDVREARTAEQRPRDRLATHVGLQGSYRTIGDDSMLEAGLYAALTVDERTRLEARLGHAEFRGRSQAIGGGAVDVVTRTPRLDLAVVHRYADRHDQLGGGLRFHPDVVGNRSVAGWLEHTWQSDLPSWTVSLRGALDELWTDPAAAAGLDGRASSLALSGYRQLGERNWVSGELAWRRIDARAPSLPRARDDEVVGSLQLGRRWTDGDIAVADPFRVWRAPAGPECPYLGHGPRESDDLHVSTWLGVTIDHILGDAAVTQILPLSDRVHFLYAAGRVDRRLCDGLGVSIDGLVGTDLEQGGAAWELAGAVTWRPGFALELDGRIGVGDAFGRADFDSRTVFARWEGVLRW